MKVICYSCQGGYHCRGVHFTNEGSCKCDCEAKVKVITCG